MPMGLLGLGFIFLVVFLLYKIVRFSVGMIARAFHSSRYESRTRITSFPKEEVRTYSISQNEFTRIANKTAYHHRRVENVEIDGNTVLIEFSSQTGLTKSRARLTFSLSGSSIGDYSIRTDNLDSSVPKNIGDIIRTEIKNAATIH